MNAVNVLLDAANNGNETSQQQQAQPIENHHMSNRPLPPLPKELNDIPASSDSDSSGEEEILIRSINTSEEDDYEKDASDLDAEELQEDPTPNLLEANGNEEEGLVFCKKKLCTVYCLYSEGI